MQSATSYKSFRETRLDDTRGLEWPVNEIMLQSLVATGRSDREIAELCGVETENVTKLRQVYGL
jgi:hypothetical protein